MRTINPQEKTGDYLIVGKTTDGFSIIEFIDGRRKGTVDISADEVVAMIGVMDQLLLDRNEQTITEILNA